MSNVNNLFINVELSGLMDFDCVTCGETVHVPITANKEEEYRCDNCSHTYKPREALKQFSNKYPDKEDVINKSNKKYKEAKERFENDDEDFTEIDFNKVKRELYNTDNVSDFYTTCDFNVSGGATFMKGKINASVQYGDTTRISGVDNVDDAREFAEFIADKLVDGKVEKVSKPSSYNISTKLDYGLDLGPLSVLLKNDMDRMYEVEYEPETFPGIINHYNHGFEVKFGDKVIDDDIQKSEFNIVANGYFILSVFISETTVDDRNEIKYTEIKDGYEIDISDILGSDVIETTVDENSINLKLSNGKSVDLDMKIDDEEVIIKGADEDIYISRVSTNINLFSSNKVMINSPNIELANETLRSVKEFINDKSKGINEVPKNGGIEKRHIFKKTDNSDIKEEMSKLPKDISDLE